MSCEFDDLIRLRDRISNLSRENEKFVASCAKELAARLLAKVIKRTPVGQYPQSSGKVGGTLRRGWTGGENGSAANYANSLAITRQGNKYTITIINPVEYSMYVEYGHRTRGHTNWVDGRFMLTISERELQRMAPAILERKLNKYLREAFHAE